MIWFTTKEIAVMLTLIERYISMSENQSNIEGLSVMAKKLEDALNYDISLKVTREQRAVIDELCDASDQLISTFSHYASDESQIYALEEMKRLASTVFASVTEESMKMKVKSDYAEIRSKVIRDQIAMELKQSGAVKSATEAVQRAQCDPRYSHVIADMEEYDIEASRLMSRAKSLDKIYNAMIQSISLSRIGMDKANVQPQF
ncbi:hypothetical protein [Parabacteroides goldsteinii]|uniref:hypothetical protein n=1 Tax=Parabacteroides goldsteinii TaxID=328812 RepID=UPI0025B644F1|nr:hypothetical protein [Parabacteroides goldsteinii]